MGAETKKYNQETEGQESEMNKKRCVREPAPFKNMQASCNSM